MYSPHFFITITEMEKLYGGSESTLYRKMNLIRDTLGKRAGTKISIIDLANYEGQQVDDIITWLETRKKIAA